MKNIRVSLLLLASISYFTVFSQNKTSELVDYVNPYMGNISHLLVPTYPTVHLPNSMLRVYPERGDYTSDLIYGLPVVVTSHRGSSAFNLSPFQGEEKDLKPVTSYSYDQELIKPYEYSVYLDEQQIGVKYAVSHQSGIYELNFVRNKPVYIALNSRNGELNWDGKAFSGYQQLDNNTRVFVYMEPDVLPQNADNKSVSGRNAHIVLSYPENTRQLKLRYGISFIDAEQAKKNLYREMSDFNLSTVAEKARKIWNETLSKIKVDGGAQDDKVVFYTSLYRTYERPVCISEDGRYFSAFDGKVHNDNGTPFYT
ncbi:MAG: glycoside hydrolase family 92 protein, partial [Petrimonas sp.]|nr:glycoside hydrolase family 92 protein [Petrimonas sp.]